MSRAFRLLCLLVIIASAPRPTSAQVPTGTPPFGSFGGGPDIINLANLNSHIIVPVLHKPGRGMNFFFDLGYDSSVWYPVTSGSSQSWQRVSNWGWAVQTDAAMGWLSVKVINGRCGGGRTLSDRTTYSGWTYHDAFGTAHPTGLTTWIGSQPGCPGTFSGSAVLTDGSGYTIYATGGSAYVVSRSGAILHVPLSQSGTGYTTDRNGNQITSTAQTQFVDTLGTTALTITGGPAPTPFTYTFSAPSGTSASFTVSYVMYTIKTSFGCAGISDYGPTSNSLIDRVTLPDGSFYQFNYEATPGFPGDFTGRLASVTLPTGGTISYTYTGGSNGMTCADGSAAGLTRTTPDGTWTYARTIGAGAASTTTITDPLNNQTVIQFQGIYETQRQTYQGSSGTGALLQTINTCYNASASPCTSTAITLPITRRTVITQLPGASNFTSQCVYFYNANGALTERDDYDYGPGAPGALLKKTTITLALLGNITAFQQQVTVSDGMAVVSQTNFNYDETAVVATSGTPQHTAVSGSRGNLTSVNSFTNGTTSLISRSTYFDTGTVQSVTDVNSAQTTYIYDATTSCGNSFPTSVTEPLTLSKSMTWSCTGGVPTSITDENGKISSAAYTDPYFWRPASTTDPTNAVTNLTYNGQTSVEFSLNFNAGASSVDVLQTLDGLGRQLLQQQRQAPGSSNFDSVESDYDSLGRPRRATLPYVQTAGQTNPTAPATTATYDALGRVLSVADAGGGSTSYTYTQNDILVTVGPAPTGENTKRRQLEYDALGRITSVCEITSAAGSGTCGQTSATTGYWTKYSYDAQGNLTSVTQNAQAVTSQQQTRAYTYDFLGRLTLETNPETGTISYTFDTDTTCSSTSSGNLVKRVDAVGNTACLAYDTLHRITSKTYLGPYAASTPGKFFVYDSATVNSLAMANAKTRLAEAYTCVSPCTTKITDLGFSYSARGEVTDVYESTPHSTGYNHTSAQFWANGVLSQLTGPGLPTLTFVPDGEGRVNTISASTGANPVTATAYNSAGLPTAVTLGSADSDAFQYDPNTLRLTQYKFNVGAQAVTGNLAWNSNGALGTLAITDAFNAANTQTCSYLADDVSRISSANCGAVWGQSFAYDSFGNITKSVLSGSAGTSFQPTYQMSPSITNRIATLPGGFAPTYDANGNSTDDNFHQYTWDAENRPVSVTSASGTVNLTYDAFGRMVEQNRSGSYTQIVYSPLGSKLATMIGSTLQKGFVPLTSGGTVVYSSSGIAYYRHTDHLGSSRLASTPTQTMYSDTAYSPFGEPYAQSGTSDSSFTGQDQDTVPGVYDFLYRKYDPGQSRWVSPDPAGLAAVSLDNPQSWNRYAYVLNNPLALIDPFGLDFCQWDDGSRDDTFADGGEDESGCISGGGTWVTDSGANSGCTWDGIRLNCPGPPDPCALPGSCGGGIGGEPIGPGVGGDGGGFTLGIRAPGQTYKQCLAQNVGNYSAGGLTGSNNFLLGNDVGNILFGNSSEGTAGFLVSEGGSKAFTAGVGTVLTAGRRTASITSLNLQGVTGPAPRILAKAGAGKIAGVLSGIAEAKLVLDLALTGAEVVGCLVPR
jgi:RHS repeat-associated protein